MKKTYWEKLKDPRWQRLRLEAMQSQNFTCELCYDDTKTLNVHHKQYFKGREPWEYDVGQLSVLCEDCHEEEHRTEDELRVLCSYLPLDGPGSRSSIASLVAGYSYGDKPTKGFDPYAYFAGMFANHVLATYGPSLENVARVAKLSATDGAEMFSLLLDYANRKNPPSTQSRSAAGVLESFP